MFDLSIRKLMTCYMSSSKDKYVCSKSDICLEVKCIEARRQQLARIAKIPNIVYATESGLCSVSAK